MHMCSRMYVQYFCYTWLPHPPHPHHHLPSWQAVLRLSCELLSGALRLVLYSAGRMTHLSVIHFPHDILLVHPAVLWPSTCQKTNSVPHHALDARS